MYWALALHKDSVRKYQMTFHETRDLIHQVLTHPNGWSKQGVVYAYRQNQPHILIHIVPERVVAQECGPALRGRKMNCAYRGTFPNRIYLDEDHWHAAPAASGMTLSEYRQYVTTHEIGHCYPLYKDHPFEQGKGYGKNGVCYGMSQQTLDQCTSRGLRPSPWPMHGEE